MLSKAGSTVVGMVPAAKTGTASLLDGLAAGFDSLSPCRRAVYPAFSSSMAEALRLCTMSAWISSSFTFLLLGS